MARKEHVGYIIHLYNKKTKKNIRKFTISKKGLSLSKKNITNRYIKTKRCPSYYTLRVSKYYV